MLRYYFPSVRLLLPLLLLLATLHCSISWAVTPADISFETAVQYLTIGNDQRAVDALQDFLKNYPADARALQATFLLGCSFQNLKNHDRALPLFTQVTTKSTDEELRANAWYQSAESFRNLKTTPANESAAAAYLAFLKLTEKIDLTAKDEASRKNWQARIINAHFWRADALAQNGNDTDALGEYQQVLLIAPKDALAPWACYAIGLLHFNKGRFSEAVAMLERISSDYPDSEIAGEAKFTLGQAYAGKAQAAAEPAAKKEFAAQAISTLQAVAAQAKVTNNTRFKAWVIIAHLHQDTGDLPAAITALEEALKVGDNAQRDMIETRLQYSHLLANEKRYQQAASSYALVAAQKDFPDLAQQALYWQGVALFKQASLTHEAVPYRAAMAALRRYLEAPPEKNDQSAEATLILAFCYEDLANIGEADAHENALAAFKQIQEKWPNSDQAMQSRDGIGRLMRSMTPEQLRVLIGKLPAGMTNWDVALQLAFAEYNAAHYAKSLEAANQVLKANPAVDVKAQALYLVGASQYQLAAIPEAIAAFQQVLTITPQGELVPFARRALLQGYLDSRQFQLAAATALALQQDKLTTTEAAQQQEEKAERLILYAAALQGNQQHKEALEVYQQLIKLYPQSKWTPTALMNSAWIAISQNDKPAAMAYYQQLVEKYPTDVLMPDACRQWGNLLVEQKEYARAIELFKKVPAASPLAAQAAFDIGWALLKMEKTDEARTQFLLVSETYPASPFAADSYSQLGEIAFQQQKYEDSVSFFAKAAAAAVNTEDAAAIIYHLGVSAFNAGEYRIAADSFQQVVTKFPAFKYAAESAFWNGESLAKLGDGQATNARAAYLQYLEKYPNEKFAPNAAAGMARAMLAAKKYPEARTDIAAAIKVCTAFENSTEKGMAARVRALEAELQYLLGMSYYEEKNYQQALTEYVRVAAYGRRGDWYYRSLLHTARCYAILKDKISATNTLRELQTAAPNSDAAKEAKAVAQEYGLPL